MQLGFVSGILYDLSLEETFAYASEEGFACVELLCWPKIEGDSPFQGVCHIDVDESHDAYFQYVRELTRIHNVQISGLGYYPNPLHGEADHRAFVFNHLKKVIHAASELDVPVVNTFIGRDQHRTAEDNWTSVEQYWPEIFEFAKSSGIKLGFENCPMLFSNAQWPGGLNLACTPSIWKKLFAQYGHYPIGLNFDPSHLIWQMIDPTKCIREFGSRFVHVHAKDTRIEHDLLQEVGIHGMGWHQAKLPGLGQVDWKAFFSALSDARYRGPICIEVEDRAYEGCLDDRKRGLRQSKRYLEQFVS
jgi:sugar phosphate isomerase/epimerase